MNTPHPEYERIAAAIEYINTNFQQQPSLDEIAQHVHLSPFHFQRLFTDWAGVSPKKFLQYVTIEYAKGVLSQNQSSLFDAAEASGLSGTGRLHDLFVNIEGMTPGEYKNYGENLLIKYTLRRCRFGNYLVASTEKGICNLYFFDNKEEVIATLTSAWKNADIVEDADSNQERVASFFDNTHVTKEKIKLHLKGTPFQLKVWNALLKIPAGSLATYGKVAGNIQQPSASRAVGTAIGSNEIAYIIPCHRVIRTIGESGGFRWGATRKKAMIGWEAGMLFNFT